jgi:transcriptional regulator with XRE-family HTH domain
MKTATHLDQYIGARIAEVRLKRGMSQSHFAREVRALVGVGWSRQAAWQVERGEKAVSATDLVAVAWVLSCTVPDLMSTSEQVSLGGEQTLRTDAIVAGEDAMPEVEAWERFEEAGDALADVRNAWARYANRIEVVRRRVADTPSLRRRIETYGAKALRSAVAQMEDAFGFRPPADFDAESAARMNPSPAMLAAFDALGTHKVSESQWRRWTRRTERSAR